MSARGLTRWPVVSSSVFVAAIAALLVLPSAAPAADVAPSQEFVTRKKEVGPGGGAVRVECRDGWIAEQGSLVSSTGPPLISSEQHFQEAGRTWLFIFGPSDNGGTVHVQVRCIKLAKKRGSGPAETVETDTDELDPGSTVTQKATCPEGTVPGGFGFKEKAVGSNGPPPEGSSDTIRQVDEEKRTMKIAVENTGSASFKNVSVEICFPELAKKDARNLALQLGVNTGKVVLEGLSSDALQPACPKNSVPMLTEFERLSAGLYASPLLGPMMKHSNPVFMTNTTNNSQTVHGEVDCLRYKQVN